MSVITISRGTFSGGKMLAECLSARLGYRCIDRDDIVGRAAARGVSEKELMAALASPPASQTATFNHRKYIYLALVQAALAEEILDGGAIYHGLAGHLLLQGGLSVLRLRVVAPLAFRLRMAQERLGLGRAETIAYIEKMDADRHKWTQYLYGMNWEDPSLYDLVINLEHITVEMACRAVAGMVKESAFERSTENQAVRNDFALASRVRAELATNPVTWHLEMEVQSTGGALTIQGGPFEEQEEIRQCALAVPGVTGLAFAPPAAAK